MAKFSITRVGLAIGTGVIMFALGFSLRGLIMQSESTIQLLSALPDQKIIKKVNPYSQYSFDNLQKLTFTSQPLKVIEELETSPQFSSYLVEWAVPELENNQALKVTGQLNIPSGPGPFPIIVMLRGYVEREDYSTGTGTKNAAAALANQGFITIAPDFLGYAGSDGESEDILIARFSRPLTVLQLLANLEQPRLTTPQGTSSPLINALANNTFDSNNIGIWAHSNGGQIALSILEITGRNYPTTLWAPVSSPFPHNILYFTNDLEDEGKYIRSQLYVFEHELENDPRQFSIGNYFKNITAAIQIHQGGRDEAVPSYWSADLAKKLGEHEVEATLFTYPEANHNLVPNWNQVMQRDLQFFNKQLKK